MKSKEVIKKLADTYETLLFVSERHPCSMSRLKNLLMSEGISETSARIERKVKLSEQQKEEVEESLTMEVEHYKAVIRRLKEDAERAKQNYERDQRWDRDKYLEASRELDVAEEKISRMKKSVWSYFKVCWEDFKQSRLEARRREREEKKRRKLNKKLIKKFERARKQNEKSKRKGGRWK